MGLSKFEKYAHDVTGLRAWRFKGESEAPAITSLRTEYKERSRLKFILNGIDGKLLRKTKGHIFNKILAPIFNSVLVQKISNAFKHNKKQKGK